MAASLMSALVLKEQLVLGMHHLPKLRVSSIKIVALWALLVVWP